MKPLLSILIRTIVGREEQFDKLYKKLYQQSLFAPVQILFEKDNKEISVGAKAQKLIEKAIGRMVVFVDDDDDVADYYVEENLRAISSNPDLDCIGFQIKCFGTSKDGQPEMASASNKWKDWAENVEGWRYVRTPYHKTPIRREIALQIGYKDMRFGEDYDFSKRLKESGLIKKEVFIDKVMYLYQYKFEEAKTKYNL